jgi:predicted HAD superfamily hydrolase
MSKKNKIIISPEWDNIFQIHKENNFSNHAFPLYLFTERLYTQLIESDCKDILFMSREGQFLKKLFERYCGIRSELGLPVTNIKTHYFYGSRNSIMSASMKEIEKEDFNLMFRYFKWFISFHISAHR